MTSAMSDWHGMPRWISDWQKNAKKDGIWINNRKQIVPYQEIFKNILKMTHQIKV